MILGYILGTKPGPLGEHSVSGATLLALAFHVPSAVESVCFSLWPLVSSV